MFIEKTKPAERPGRVGVVCSGPSLMLKKCIETLRRGNPGGAITLLAPRGLEPIPLSWGALRVIVSHEYGRFSLFKTGFKKVGVIRGEGYDKVVLLYNNPLGMECLNLDFLSLFLGGRVWIFDSEERLFPLRGKRWLAYILPLRLSISFLNKVFFTLLFPLILTLVLSAKLFKKKSQSTRELIRYGG